MGNNNSTENLNQNQPSQQRAMVQVDQRRPMETQRTTVPSGGLPNGGGKTPAKPAEVNGGIDKTASKANSVNGAAANKVAPMTAVKPVTTGTTPTAANKPASVAASNAVTTTKANDSKPAKPADTKTKPKPSAISNNIPVMQYAQVCKKPGGPLEYKKIAVQLPDADEVLIHMRYSGVSHADLLALQGNMPRQAKSDEPQILGHEGVGTIVAVGAEVRDLKLGDTVAVRPTDGEDGAPRARRTGVDVDGTFQQYSLARSSAVTRLPRDLDLKGAACLLGAGVTAYRALRDSGARAGQDVAIVGAGGGVGHLALQFARAMGLRTIAVESGEDKRDACNTAGATRYVDSSRRDTAREVKAASLDGYGPHAVIVASSGPEPYGRVWEWTRPRGTVVLVGLVPGAEVRAPLNDLVCSGVTLRGCGGGDRRDGLEVVDFYRRGLIKVQTKTVGLTELAGVFDMMAKGKTAGRYVVDMDR